MFSDNKIWLGNSENERITIYPKMSNRHGMIAGATGTGKTVTLKVIAEAFSDMGVPVFLADVKGDLSGMCENGMNSENMQERIAYFGMKDGFEFKSYPVNFWDVYGKLGMPLRTTISEMGPLLLSKVLGLNDTQTAVLKVVFKIADDEGLLLIDTKDLRSMLTYVSENAKNYSLNYGNMAPQSLNAIIRAVVAIEAEGGDMFFGEPALDIRDWIATNFEGKGMINILDCQTLINNQTMYSAFMLWMLSELYETLPEVGDMDKPRMVFFFDEAHILFDKASKDLLEKIEQIVKLIRSKGVSIFFITQNPKDIPDGVLAQLGTKIEHALRAYTLAELKGAKIAAESFRANPDFDTLDAMLNLGIGEALVSVLDETGVPTVVQKTKILPPQSKMGPVDAAKRTSVINESNLSIKYSEAIDRDSAYEFLQRKYAEAAQLKEDATKEKAQQKALEKEELKRQKTNQRVAKSVGNSVAGTIGRELGKSVGSSVGGSFGKKLGGNVGASLGRGLIETLFGRK